MKSGRVIISIVFLLVFWAPSAFSSSQGERINSNATVRKSNRFFFFFRIVIKWVNSQSSSSFTTCQSSAELLGPRFMLLYVWRSVDVL